MFRRPFLNSEFFDIDGFIGFDRIWNLPRHWFDKPNQERGGWSGVSRHTLETLQGEVHVFIKRQQHYVTRTLLHPFSGIPTFEKELKNILRLRRHQIPTLKPLYFGKINDRAILITKALDDYQSLDEIDPSTLSATRKKRLLQRLAILTRRLHERHYMHNCYYPKHIFAKPVGDDWKLRLIDLEKMRWRFSAYHAMLRDLKTFYRHADPRWNSRDRLYFFKAYLQLYKLDDKSKRLWKKVASTNKQNT